MFKRYTQHPYSNSYQPSQTIELEGEIKLAYALLVIAIQDSLAPDTKLHYRQKKKRVIVNPDKASALEWVMSDDIDYIFSFLRCCEYLNLPPLKTRAIILSNKLDKTKFHSHSLITKAPYQAPKNTSHMRTVRYKKNGETSRRARRIRARIKKHC